MPIGSSSYKLKLFDNAHDPQFAEALLLYVRNTSPPERTETNEIAFWLEKSRQNQDWRFYVFGFYRDDLLVGFAEAGYFPEERLLVFDYLVLDAEQRRNNVFYEFVDHVKRYLEGVHPEYRYTVAEVAYGPNEEYPSPHACLMTRLLKLQGFRLVHALYLQPRLLLNDPESEMRANLLIYSTGDIETLRVETYLSIVRTIYFKYYLPWNCGIGEAAQAYEEHLKELYTRIAESLSGKHTIPVNGHKLVFNAAQRPTEQRLHRVVRFTIQALVAVVLLTVVLLSLRYAFKLTDASFALIYALAVCSFLAMAAIVSKEARLVLSELLTFVRHLWPKSSGMASRKTRQPALRRKKDSGSTADGRSEPQ